MATQGLEHQPVLVQPVLRLLDPKPGDVLLDGTVGLGGHAAVLIPRIMPGGRYVGLDLDEELLAEARQRLASLAPPGAVQLIHANYAEFPEVLSALGLQRVEHLFLDLGANSAQLSDPARGFSFEREGPLDMRFDRAQQQRRALDLVNALSENDLADLFYNYGQEGLSREIARRICQVRHSGRITTTRALAQAVESACTAAGGRPGRIHPATRVFQALRIAVNDELKNLETGLQKAPDFLALGGKLAVISFHSLEDGLVKRFLRGAKSQFEELTDRPIVADPAEREANPRSRSAKLRVACRRAQE